MNISSTYYANPGYSSATDTAKSGLSEQLDQFEKSSAEIAKNSGELSDINPGQIKALIDQLDIVNHVKANARSLQANNDRIGTLIDLRA